MVTTSPSFKKADVDPEERDKAIFALTEAKEHLGSTIACYDELITKSYKVAAVYAAVINGLLAYGIANYDPAYSLLSQHTTVLTSFIYVAILIASSPLLYFILSPHELHFTGNDPKALLSDDVISNTYPSIVRGEARNYTERIKGNHKITKEVAFSLRCSIAVLFIGPVAALLLRWLLLLAYLFAGEGEWLGLVCLLACPL